MEWSSVRVLASTFRHMPSSRALARTVSVSLSSSSMYLPWRTSPTSAKPSRLRECPMAFPWGSSTPCLRVTWTLAFISPRSLQRRLLQGGGTAHVARPLIDQDAEPPRHLLVGLLDLAEVAAETVLVHLFVGPEIPQPARIGADLVGQHYAHHVVLI